MQLSSTLGNSLLVLATLNSAWKAGLLGCVESARALRLQGSGDRSFMQQQPGEVVQTRRGRGQRTLQLQDFCSEVAEETGWSVRLYLPATFLLYQKVLFLLPFCFSLPCFFFKSMVVSMVRVGKTPATKGSSSLLQTSASALQVMRKTDPHLQPLLQRSVLNLNFMAVIAGYGAAVTSPCSPSHGGHCAFQCLLH